MDDRDRDRDISLPVVRTPNMHLLAAIPVQEKSRSETRKISSAWGR